LTKLLDTGMMRYHRRAPDHLHLEMLLDRLAVIRHTSVVSGGIQSSQLDIYWWPGYRLDGRFKGAVQHER